MNSEYLSKMQKKYIWTLDIHETIVWKKLILKKSADYKKAWKITQ